MRQAQIGNTVKVNYCGKLCDGSVFAKTKGNEPLEFSIGSSSTIPGLEKAVIGMGEGDSKTVVLPPEDAFGNRNAALVFNVSRNRLPNNIKPEVGMNLEVRGKGSGQPTSVTITEVDNDSVVLDANHPLAGKSVVFDIEMLEVR